MYANHLKKVQEKEGKQETQRGRKVEVESRNKSRNGPYFSYFIEKQMNIRFVKTHIT